MSNKIKKFKEKHPKVFTGICVGGVIVATAIITKKINMITLDKNHRLFSTNANSYCMLGRETVPLGTAKSCIKQITEATLESGETIYGYCDTDICLPEGVGEITFGGLKEAMDEIMAEGYATADSKMDVAMIAWIKD